MTLAQHINGDGHDLIYEGEVEFVNDNDEVSWIKFNRPHCCATFYDHINYGGKLGTICNADENTELNFPGSWNDKLSSIYRIHVTCVCQTLLNLSDAVEV